MYWAFPFSKTSLYRPTASAIPITSFQTQFFLENKFILNLNFFDEKTFKTFKTFSQKSKNIIILACNTTLLVGLWLVTDNIFFSGLVFKLKSSSLGKLSHDHKYKTRVKVNESYKFTCLLDPCVIRSLKTLGGHKYAILNKTQADIFSCLFKVSLLK